MRDFLEANLKDTIKISRQGGRGQANDAIAIVCLQLEFRSSKAR